MGDLDQLSSGILGFDAIVTGGLVAGASYIIQGKLESGRSSPTGSRSTRRRWTAKSCPQRCWRRPRAAVPVPVHPQLLRPATVGAEVQFLSALDTLDTEGFDEVVTLLRSKAMLKRRLLLDAPGILFGLYETQARLLPESAELGLDLRLLTSSGARTCSGIHRSSGCWTRSVTGCSTRCRILGARRVFIDSLSAIGRAATIPVRMVSFFSALMHELPVRDVTMLASWEIGTCSAATCALGCQSCRG